MSRVHQRGKSRRSGNSTVHATILVAVVVYLFIAMAWGPVWFWGARRHYPHGRTESLNRLRGIGLAVGDFQFGQGAFPAASSIDADGKPLLSWRVYMLPYLDQNPLFLRFHLDEPWNSPHNRALIEAMPEIFEHPNLNLDAGMTVYLAPVGVGSVISEKPSRYELDAATERLAALRGVSEIPDGDSNTLLVVEVNRDRAVIWTKPADYRWQEQTFIGDGLGGNWSNDPSWQSVTADGAARTMFHVDDVTLKRLFQRDDGGAVDWNRID